MVLPYFLKIVGIFFITKKINEYCQKKGYLKLLFGQMRDRKYYQDKGNT